MIGTGPVVTVLRTGARVVAAGATLIGAWGAASSLIALGFAIDVWTAAVGGGPERTR